MTPSILVVGAGPTGLVLALSLAQNGINVRIIEKDTLPKVGQRGAGIQARTQEVHHILGSLSDILSLASLPSLMKVYPEGSANETQVLNLLSGSAEPSDAFPITKAVVLGQDKQVEILTNHLKKHGREVELGTEMISLEQFPDHVVVNMLHIKEGEQVEEAATFDYIVGTDGAHSKVRKQLALSFLGETRKTERMIVGDIRIHGGMDQDFWHIWGDVNSSMALLRPVGEDPGLYSFVIGGANVDLDKIANRDEVSECLKRITGLTDIAFGDLVWLSQYIPNIRMVDSFRKGRVLVAGDAAHVHSPAGGQGMNSGVQDSFNLGWKLALVAKGLAKPEFLDSYNAERLPVIAEMLQLTTALHGKMSETDSDASSKWDRGGSLDQLGVNYRGTPFVLDERGEQDSVSANTHYDQRRSRILRAGDRAPDASSLVNIQERSNKTRLYDLFGSTYHTVLIFPASLAGTEPIVDVLKKYPEGTIRSILILPVGSSEVISASVAVDLMFQDQLDNARKAYQVQPNVTTIVAVRPDAVVGAIVTNADGLRRYFGRLFI